jgi:hypothetical protein
MQTLFKYWDNLADPGKYSLSNQITVVCSHYFSMSALALAGTLMLLINSKLMLRRLQRAVDQSKSGQDVDKNKWGSSKQQPLVVKQMTKFDKSEAKSVNMRVTAELDTLRHNSRHRNKAPLNGSDDRLQSAGSLGSRISANGSVVSGSVVTCQEGHNSGKSLASDTVSPGGGGGGSEGDVSRLSRAGGGDGGGGALGGPEMSSEVKETGRPRERSLSGDQDAPVVGETNNSGKEGTKVPRSNSPSGCKSGIQSKREHLQHPAAKDAKNGGDGGKTDGDRVGSIKSIIAEKGQIEALVITLKRIRSFGFLCGPVIVLVPLVGAILPLIPAVFSYSLIIMPFWIFMLLMVFAGMESLFYMK